MSSFCYKKSAERYVQYIFDDRLFKAASQQIINMQ